HAALIARPQAPARTTSGCPEMPNTGPLEPTAKQTTRFPRIHETLARMLVPPGCGLSAIVHAEPSQPATSVRFAAVARCAPTVTQAVGETQVTAANPERNERLGPGR